MNIGYAYPIRRNRHSTTNILYSRISCMTTVSSSSATVRHMTDPKYKKMTATNVRFSKKPGISYCHGIMQHP